MNENNVLHKLIKHVAKLPGLGQRSARRIVLHLMSDRVVMHSLLELLQRTDAEVRNCVTCGNLDVISPCGICTSGQRSSNVICIVENVSDLWAVERSQMFHGQYHVLGGLLSALDNCTPEKLRIPQLLIRIRKYNISEVIIAVSATLDGQTTSHYISSMLSEVQGLQISRLAFGIPIGAELEYMDDSTIGIAMKLRSVI